MPIDGLKKVQFKISMPPDRVFGKGELGESRG